MAIAPTGDVYKSLTFDGKTSRSYGVYITGEAVYNAPEREVEMISIPGRNGAFALDKGRFENVTVTYPAGIFADNETDFAAAISDFRNYLCSRKGYCRLTDEYNPNEYRMAVYKSGLEVDPAQLRAGEFEITFECKPQRWLTSGETKVTIAQSGDTITNPTLFESGPLLEVVGYGDIGIGSQVITLENVTIGEIVLNNGHTITNVYSSTYKVSLTLGNLQNLNVGDDIIVPAVNCARTVHLSGVPAFTSAQITSMQNVDSASISIVASDRFASNIVFSPVTFVYGTASTGSTIEVLYKVTFSGGSHSGVVIRAYYDYDGDDTIDVYILNSGYGGDTINVAIPYIAGDSTLPAFTGTAYIDLDIGEAWTENNGEVAPINNAVVMPAILPTLASGSNAITFDNTITSFKITPRWWKV